MQAAHWGFWKKYGKYGNFQSKNMGHIWDFGTFLAKNMGHIWEISMVYNLEDTSNNYYLTFRPVLSPYHFVTLFHTKIHTHITREKTLLNFFTTMVEENFEI